MAEEVKLPPCKLCEAMTPRTREEVIELMARAYALADDECDPAQIDDYFSACVHDGDCTKQIHTCILCRITRIREFCSAQLAALEQSGVVDPDAYASPFRSNADE